MDPSFRERNFQQLMPARLALEPQKQSEASDMLEERRSNQELSTHCFSAERLSGGRNDFAVRSSFFPLQRQSHSPILATACQCARVTSNSCVLDASNLNSTVL